MKTWNAKADEVERAWWIVDATDQTLGRLATQIARTIRGKNKPQYTPHVDTGDFVVVINTDKLKVSRELDGMNYYSHSRFFGGLKTWTAKEQMEKDSSVVLTTAVKGMLPKTKLGRSLIGHLKAYKDGKHPHLAQKPQPLKIIDSKRD
jgi:large subunit ribosomal protein L13